MSEHNAFLRLAATAVDFQLDPHEARTLGQHLEGCDECRRMAESLSGDAAALRSLPRPSPSPRIAAAIARASRGETRTTRSPLLLLGLGFLLVAGLAGAVIGGAAIRQALESDRQVVSPSPAPTDAAIVPPSPEPSATIDPRLGRDWQTGGLTVAAQIGPVYGQMAVAPGEPGFVLVGRGACVPPADGERETCFAASAVSSDGRAWLGSGTPSVLDVGTNPATSGPEPGMIDVASSGGVTVAIGYAAEGDPSGPDFHFGPAIWRSENGLEWERIPVGTQFAGTCIPGPGDVACARFQAIEATSHGFVIAGAIFRPEAPRAALWTSVDGRTWERPADEPGAFDPTFDAGGYVDTGEEPGFGGPKALAEAGGRIAAVGQVCESAELGLCTAAVWLSDDGRTWRRAQVEAHDGGLWSVTHDGDGFVASGVSCAETCIPFVMRSTSGERWQELALTAAPEGGLGTLAATGGRLMALSDPLSGSPIFWSDDGGATWSPASITPEPAMDLTVYDLAIGEGLVVAVGQTADQQTVILTSPPGE
jgi:anti-sigma factor RsiW